MADAPMTVVETAEFLKHATRIMSDSEREALVSFKGANPEAGKIMPETGGVRKVRWGLSGRGKRGDVRVVYYYHSERLPLFLLTAYTKNERANLTQAERNAMKRLVRILVAGNPGKK
jgi:mRNA-degrading endonuclease RelE of RelBE toxin-antitoxin system